MDGESQLRIDKAPRNSPANQDNERRRRFYYEK
jgi:hypothetical protein